MEGVLIETYFCQTKLVNTMLQTKTLTTSPQPDQLCGNAWEERGGADVLCGADATQGY